MSATPKNPDEYTGGAQQWTNPFPEGTYLHDLYGRRIRNEQDIVIIIDDYWIRRGTGKSVATLQLAAGMDQTQQGITKTKASLEPEELREAYSNEPLRSGLVLDEGEVGLSNRDAMTNVNKALREIFSMGRVEQKYTVINAPSWNFIDKDVRKLATLWITMLRKGLGLIHEVKPHPYLGKILTPKVGLIEFKDIKRGTQLREVYNYLTDEKQKKIDGEDGSGYIPRSKHQNIIEQTEEEVERETRNSILYDVYHHPKIDASQGKLGDVVDLTQPGVKAILDKVAEERGDK